MFPTFIDPSFQADSLFSPDDCVLSDVSLSDALDRRDLNLDRRDFNERREFTLNEKHFTDDKQVVYKPNDPHRHPLQDVKHVDVAVWD